MNRIPYTTFCETIRQVWPDCELPIVNWITWAKYQGVEIQPIKGSFRDSNGKDIGLQLKVADGQLRADIRRVMLHDGQLDTDALRAKHAELAAIAKNRADELAAQQQVEQERHECLRRVQALVGTAGPCIRTHDGYSVRMHGVITARQLAALDAVLGPQIATVQMVVPEDKAVQVWAILQEGKT